MKKTTKLVLPALALSIGLIGCSSADLSSLEAEVAALKQEVAQLKGEQGSSQVEHTSDAGINNSNANRAYSLGESFVYNGVTYTITELERKQTLGDSIEADDGKEFLTYQMNIENTSNEDVKFSQSNYSLVLSNGEIQDNYIFIDFEDKHGALGNGTLASGGTKTGWVAFHIPQGDEPLELRRTTGNAFNLSTAFKVKLK